MMKYAIYQDKYEHAEDEDLSVYRSMSSQPCIITSLMPEAKDMTFASVSGCGGSDLSIPQLDQHFLVL
jgi:hypothetical protein